MTWDANGSPLACDDTGCDCPDDCGCDACWPMREPRCRPECEAEQRATWTLIGPTVARWP